MVKMSVLPQFIYSFNAVSIKTPTRFFGRHKQAYSKIYVKSKGCRTAKTILKKGQSGRTQSNIKAKKVCCWYRVGHIAQWNTAEMPKTDSLTNMSKLIF
jgi:hypothetical protein